MTLALTSPVTANAQSSMDLFDVTSDVSPNTVIAPGDVWSDSFKITNKTNETIQIKLDHLENTGDSSLYDALQVEINGRSFERLNETYVFHTDFRFPDECKNEYQGKTFRARLLFQCEAPEGSVRNQNGDIVQTGDETSFRWNIIQWILCGFILLWVLLWRTRRQQKE